MQIEMAVVVVEADPLHHMPVVFLREVGGERILPIWIGHFEGEAIRLHIDNVQPPRPMTHDLLKTVIEELAGRVERVVVCDLKDSTFYAAVHIQSEKGRLTVDARPSDAIALAVRTGARIFVEEAVIQSARSVETRREAVDVGRLQKWLEHLSEDDLGKYKM